jgi:hypothetical protein
LARRQARVSFESATPGEGLVNVATMSPELVTPAAREMQLPPRRPVVHSVGQKNRSGVGKQERWAS